MNTHNLQLLILLLVYLDPGMGSHDLIEKVGQARNGMVRSGRVYRWPQELKDEICEAKRELREKELLNFDRDDHRLLAPGDDLVRNLQVMLDAVPRRD